MPQNKVQVSQLLFLAQAKRHVSSNIYGDESGKRSTFISLFGVSATVCANVWNAICPNISEAGRPVHLVWAVFFLESYSFEAIGSSLFCVTPKTFRKLCWIVVKSIADMNVVSEWFSIYIYILSFLIFRRLTHFFLKIHWNKNLIKGGYCFEDGLVAYASVDGTDCRIREPSPFNPKWYSHKFHGPGLRYEIGICIRTGHLVWVHGLFP